VEGIALSETFNNHSSPFPCLYMAALLGLDDKKSDILSNVILFAPNSWIL
jgi:hypothetical protein